MDFEPAYFSLSRSGELVRRAEQAFEHMAACNLCAWECKVDRLAGKIGVCRSGPKARVSSFGPHLGEEEPLRGQHGSGTIFFARCNLRCQFCQNYEISQADTGPEMTAQELADTMLELQELGCHNINFVSPSHVVAQILAALAIAAKAGLRLPLVYNTGGYDSLTALHLLEGVIDIYMPDMKYANPHSARKYSKALNYPVINQVAVQEMHRQVGDLQLDESGIAKRGLLIRHLILPNGLAGTRQILHFLAQKISLDTYLNLMDQYRPCYRAHLFDPISRAITPLEYESAIQLAHAEGLHRLDHRPHRFSL